MEPSRAGRRHDRVGRRVLQRRMAYIATRTWRALRRAEKRPRGPTAGAGGYTYFSIPAVCVCCAHGAEGDSTSGIAVAEGSGD